MYMCMYMQTNDQFFSSQMFSNKELFRKEYVASMYSIYEKKKKKKKQNKTKQCLHANTLQLYNRTTVQLYSCVCRLCEWLTSTN